MGRAKISLSIKCTSSYRCIFSYDSFLTTRSDKCMCLLTRLYGSTYMTLHVASSWFYLHAGHLEASRETPLLPPKIYKKYTLELTRFYSKHITAVPLYVVLHVIPFWCPSIEYQEYIIGSHFHALCVQEVTYPPWPVAALS